VQKDILQYKELPDDTIYVMRTFLGKIKPRSVMVVPVFVQERPSGVLVCASIYDYTREDRDMLELIRHYFGVAVNNGANYEKSKRLANELAFQNKLIQEQYEDMKKRLDAKTHLLNGLVNVKNRRNLYALDTRGTVLVWGKEAEALHSINAKNAVGKPIERLYEELGWPPIVPAVHSALLNGGHEETLALNLNGETLPYKWQIECVYNDHKEAVSLMVSAEPLPL
jgi:transcriptional regulator with PAS, ATPase and Fis domain